MTGIISVPGGHHNGNKSTPRRPLPCHNLNMLVLASSSPRRRELLTQAGFAFQVHPANLPEDPDPSEDPIAYVTRLAREKAEAVFREIAAQSPAPPQVVLGADTTVVLDNQILGKPESEADAVRMLRLLSGRTHRVITGVAVVTPEHTEIAAEVTAVQFLTLSDEEIEAYIATGEPMDKAGAYAIQGRAARWIPRVVGCYFNVMGLPIALVSTLLESIEPDSLNRKAVPKFP
jgi:septum formation protein